MHEITYYSLANPGLKKADIEAILQTSRTFNAKNELSGCLLLHNNQFIQILEGDASVIRDLIARIKNDKRHSFFYPIAEGEKEHRTFPNWTMAYRQLSDDDLKGVNESLFIANFLSFASLAQKPTHTIQSFWERVQRLLTNDFTS